MHAVAVLSLSLLVILPPISAWGSNKDPLQVSGSMLTKLPSIIIEGIQWPWGIAVNQSGEIIVVESYGHCVSIFSPIGEKLQSFGTYGSGKGQFKNPAGVAVDGDGNILVVDYGNQCIQKFSSDGQFITAVGKNGSNPLQFYVPNGIGIHPSNKKVYVVDSNNHRVQVLNSDLTFSSSFGSIGNDNGQFQYPNDVAFDSTGNVYVTDFRNDRIQVFTAEGGFLRKWQVLKPEGVTIDANDLVYVTSSAILIRKSSSVYVFTFDGELKTSFGTAGNKAGQFISPTGIAVNSSGMIYVSDMFNDRVQVFKL